MAWGDYDSPLGRLTLVAGIDGLRAVHFPGRAPILGPAERHSESLAAACVQLREYFAGERETFDLALARGGTAFRRRVWNALRELPYGEVTTYGRLADELDVGDSQTATAAQKVAWAIGAVPVPIVVPCHRVIGADGSLTGYLGGVQRKRALLDFEAAGDARAEFWQHRSQLELL